MNFPLALTVIEALLQEFKKVPPDSICSLFIGVDVYQSIPKGKVYDEKKKEILDAHQQTPNADISQQLKDIRKHSYLWQLVDLFNEFRSISNLKLYPAFAGTKFGDLSIAGSSVPETFRVHLSFLTPQGMEDAIMSGKNRQKLVNDEFRQELFFLGGLPRPSIAFADGTRSFDDIWTHYIV